jgi:hypothetical protein
MFQPIWSLSGVKLLPSIVAYVVKYMGPLDAHVFQLVGCVLFCVLCCMSCSQMHKTQRERTELTKSNTPAH